MLFATLPIKLKLGQQIGGGTANSKPTGPIIMMGKSESPPTSSKIIFITLFSAGVQRCCCAFYQPPHKLCNFAEPNWHVLTFLHPIFTMQDHILSTAGDAAASSSVVANVFSVTIQTLFASIYTT
jgi:hypothetical protein